jgi:hypothetical protein
MSDVPTNQRLWNSLVVQAKAKFRTWPSIPASKWVREQYTQKGGQFVDSKQMTAAKKKREAAAKGRTSGGKGERGDTK